MPCRAFGSQGDIQSPIEIIGDGSKVDLAGGPSTSLRRASGDPTPSHSAYAAASFPCSEDFLDPAAYPVDRLIPGFERGQRALFVAAPHTGCDNAGNAAFRTVGLAEMAAAIGAVGKYLTGIVG